MMKYQISSFDLLKELLSNIPADDSCLEWPRGKRDCHGYGNVKMGGNDTLVHRASWIVTFGEIPQGIKILHHCDNPLCFRPSHLFSGTQRQNNQDCVNKGRSKIIPLVTEADVILIRSEYRSGTTQVALARRFNTTQGNISKIVLRKTWDHLQVAAYYP
jgi:hypothetical protein